jgi:hypothetical protein
VHPKIPSPVLAGDAVIARSPRGGLPVNDVEQPTGDAPGYCHRCQRWSSAARVIAEIHSDAGAGGTVVRCRDCDLKAASRRSPRATSPRRYSA